MIIDDDSVDRWILRRTIEKTGIAKEIVEVTGGVEALKMITENTSEKELPDLIFLDINMPVLNGFQFLETFEQLSKEYKNRCHIAVMSAIESAADRKKAMKCVCVIGYYVKPILEESILQMIQQQRFTQAS